MHRKPQNRNTGSTTKPLAVSTEKVRMLTAKKLKQAVGGTFMARNKSQCGRMCPTHG